MSVARLFRVKSGAVLRRVFGIASAVAIGVTVLFAPAAARVDDQTRDDGATGEPPQAQDHRIGPLDALQFAIVGSTRPANLDDLQGYPRAVIGRIWNDIAAQNPRPSFAIGTGNYMFARRSGSAAQQLDMYLQARAAFSNPFFPAMGNHECTGPIGANCGPGAQNGMPESYVQFLQKLLGPIDVAAPYYVVYVTSREGPRVGGDLEDHGDGHWTAKFVFIAANAWSSDQATWLEATMAERTTYTFVVRNEESNELAAPGVAPSEQIITRYPFTMRIEGSRGAYAHLSNREIIVGNGGAPLGPGGAFYGYVVAQRRVDGAIQFTAYDYSSNAAVDSFAVDADGSPAPVLPMTSDQCKNGGWQTFGVFTNQGDCVSSIVSMGK